jgi:pimeloyl-ACP methyl ester carboxylesterase
LSDITGLSAIACGTGPTVVLVHGALGDYRQWSEIAARLESQFHVVAVSRRHHWPNPAPAKDAVYTYESNRDDLLAWLTTLPAPVHLVGHSYGAGVALLTAVAEPRLVKTLVLIEPAFASLVAPTGAGYPSEAASRDTMMATLHSLVRAGADERAVETLIDWVQGGAGGFSSLPAPARDGLMENAGTIGPTFAVAARNVSRDQLTNLRVPTLVLNGERTRPWYRLIGESVSGAIPDSEHGTIADAGHMAIVENPDSTATLILGFLSRH